MAKVIQKKIAKAVFDTAATDSAGVANTTVAAHGSGVFLPAGAVVTAAYYLVNTTFTSATDAGTIAMHAVNASDILTAIAISDGTNVFDAGVRGTKLGYPNLGADVAHDTAVEVAALFAGVMLSVGSTSKQIIFTVAEEALTAGKLTLYVEFVV